MGGWGGGWREGEGERRIERCWGGEDGGGRENNAQRWRRMRGTGWDGGGNITTGIFRFVERGGFIFVLRLTSTILVSGGEELDA